MKKYLSFGGGVNSTAMLLMLLDAKEEFEAVFVDLGLELPETYEYIKMLQRDVCPITVILGLNREGRTLYEHCVHYRNFPTRRWKWCTHRFKLYPLEKYYKKPCIDFVGIDANESHRVKANWDTNYRTKLFPLIEQGINREDCIEIIKEHGLPLPLKSGCYICSNQPARHWEKLYREHPELYERAKHLEEITNERLRELGKRPRYYYSHKALPYVVGEYQVPMFTQARK